MARREIGLMRIFLVWVAIFLAHVDARSLTKEEDSELKAKLKFLNRPAVKTIYTEEGDIIDCVNIRNQPAFDHPLLKNHQIQMKPTILPEGVESKDHSDVSQVPEMIDGGCPSDTVPIRRTQAEDLLRASSLSNFGRKNGFNVTTSFDGYDHDYAMVLTRGGDFYGTKFDVNVWAPDLGNDTQMSLAQTWLIKGSGSQLNTIEVGWQINPTLYGDAQSRLFLYWTADNYDKTGCYNLLCSGFILVSNIVIPGGTLKPVSTLGGTQWQINLLVFLDKQIGNWWLMYNDLYVGYWPKAIFTSLGGSPAAKVRWGGEIATHHDSSMPSMGSGRYPKEGFGYSAFMKKLEVVDDQNYLREAPDDTYTYADVSSCYGVDDVRRSSDTSWTKYFYFGGPGGYC